MSLPTSPPSSSTSSSTASSDDAQLTFNEKSLGKKRVLLVRPDRIGDVVLSLPTIEALHVQNPNVEIDMLVREAVWPVVQHAAHLSDAFLYKPESTHSGFWGFWRLVKELRQKKYDISVTLQVHFRVSLALFFARVSRRIGPYSKWYSYLLFNRGQRQKRSRVEMHEADYNLMLLKMLGVRASSRNFEPHVMVDGDAKERVRAHLKSEGVDLEKPFVVIHPGMGGSALNWPEGYYIDLAQRLVGRGIPVVLTGSAAERRLVEKMLGSIRESLGENDKKNLNYFLGADSQSGLSDFIALLSLSKVVVAPSTGPLHLAVSLGKKTVSFFSPIRVQSALRWGPYAADESKHTVLVPDALCGQDFKCIGKKCHFYYCMEKVGVEEALRSTLHHYEEPV